MKCSLGISNFLEEICSLSHSIVFLYFFALTTEESFLISPCYSLELCVQMDRSSSKDHQGKLLRNSVSNSQVWVTIEWRVFSLAQHLSMQHFTFSFRKIKFETWHEWVLCVAEHKAESRQTLVLGVDAREFPGRLLRLDPTFAYARPPSSWPLSRAEFLTLAPCSDRIPVELFQILRDDAVESAALNMQYAICTQYAICWLLAHTQEK